MTSATGLVTTATGRATTATGQVITATGLVITVTGQVIIATGQAISVTDQVITVTDQVITVTGQVTLNLVTDGVIGQVTIPGPVTTPDGVHLMMTMELVIHQVLFYIHQCPMVMVDLHLMTMDIEKEGIQDTA